MGSRTISVKEPSGGARECCWYQLSLLGCLRLCGKAVLRYSSTASRFRTSCVVSYPLDIRGSGIGWPYAIGKIGSLLAPVMGGVVLSLNWSVSRICATNAMAALCIAVAIIILQRHLAAAAARSREAATDAESERQVA